MHIVDTEVFHGFRYVVEPDETVTFPWREYHGFRDSRLVIEIRYGFLHQHLLIHPLHSRSIPDDNPELAPITVICIVFESQLIKVLAVKIKSRGNKPVIGRLALLPIIKRTIISFVITPFGRIPTTAATVAVGIDKGITVKRRRGAESLIIWHRKW